MKATLLGMVLLAIAACGKGGDDAKWPPAPTDGTPAVVEFVKMEGQGKEAKAHMRIFNFADKKIKTISMRLHYLDKDGKELDDFPWSHSAGAGIVGPKETVVKKMGAFIPDGTTKVTAELLDAEFMDGSRWKSGGE